MAAAAAGFGAGLGQLIGAEIGASDLNRGSNDVNNVASGFSGQVEPYNTFGQSFIQPATGAVGAINNVAGSSEGYDQFMKGYTNTPAAQYELQQADAVQNSSAGARHQLLSGANERALGTINNGIVSTNANAAYDEYRSGNSQQFGQLESALGNMFTAIGVGTTATGQQAGVDVGQMNAQSQLAQAQAKNDQGKGSGLGSMFSALGSLPAMF